MKLLRMSMRSPGYSIVIPAFNESQRIGRTLERVLDYATRQKWDVEVIVVNDGSRDDTSAIVLGYARRDSRIRLLENPGNHGKGYSVRNGMLHARGDILIFTDADLSSPIEQCANLVEAIAAGADVAIGSRWIQPQLMTERQPVVRQLLGRIYNLLPRTVLGLNFKDTQCGLKAFTRRVVAEIFTRQHIEGWGFDAELLFLARRAGFRTAEVPVGWAHDDRSKIKPFADGLSMAKEVLLVRYYSIMGEYKRPTFAPEPSELRFTAPDPRAKSV